EEGVELLSLRVDAELGILLGCGDRYAAGESLLPLSVSSDRHFDGQDVACLQLGVPMERAVEGSIAVDRDRAVVTGRGGDGVSGFETRERIGNSLGRFVDGHRRLVG